MFGFRFQNIRPEKLILAWKSAENNVHFPPLKLTGFSLAKKLPGEGTVLVKATFFFYKETHNMTRFYIRVFKGVVTFLKRETKANDGALP